MQKLMDRIRNGEVLLADGAIGTMLFLRGLAPGQCPEKTNLDRPYILEDIARLYLDAGADLIQTNTFGGSPLKLAHYGLDKQTEEINTRAVKAVRKVVADKAYVAASVGPCGKLLQPYGDTLTRRCSRLGFERQIRTLVAAAVDIICIETMTDLNEAIIAVKVARRVTPSTPISVTMTFDVTPEGIFTIMGDTIAKCVDAVTEAGADIVGSNCGNGIENMTSIAAEFKKISKLPLIFQANAGLPTTKGEQLVYPETPQFMAEKCRCFLEMGVSIVGGCCGTTPDHIAALRKMIDEFKRI